VGWRGPRVTRRRIPHLALWPSGRHPRLPAHPFVPHPPVVPASASRTDTSTDVRRCRGTDPSSRPVGSPSTIDSEARSPETRSPLHRAPAASSGAHSGATPG